MAPSKCLFVTWDGPQVSYLEGLFLPIFERLAEQGYRFHVLQFTWGSPERIAATEALCRAAGVPYRAAKVQRWGGAIGPLTSAVCGARHIASALRDWEIDTLMPRSLMPALAVLAMGSRKGLRLVFDADGFAADERVDFASLPEQSATYRILRAIEARTARQADRVLVRTPRAIDILAGRADTNRAKFHVVGNGRNPQPFLTGWPQRTDGEFRLCYAGSIGAQYCPDQMVDVALRLRSDLPNLAFHVFTADAIALHAALDRAGIGDRSWVEVSRLPPGEIPAALLQCDLALALRRPAFSTQGVAPIKIGEYLLAGLPVIATEDVGPIEPAIEAGVMLPVRRDLSGIWPWVRDAVLPHQTELRKRAQAVGLAQFSLEASVASYLNALSPEVPPQPTGTAGACTE